MEGSAHSIQKHYVFCKHLKLEMPSRYRTPCDELMMDLRSITLNGVKAAETVEFKSLPAKYTKFSIYTEIQMILHIGLNKTGQYLQTGRKNQ